MSKFAMYAEWAQQEHQEQQEKRASAGKLLTGAKALASNPKALAAAKLLGFAGGGVGAAALENRYLFEDNLLPETAKMNLITGGLLGSAMSLTKSGPARAAIAMSAVPKHLGIGMYDEARKLGPIVRQMGGDLAGWLAANKEITETNRDTANLQLAAAKAQADAAGRMTPAQELATRGVKAVDMARAVAPWTIGALLAGGLGFAAYKAYRHANKPEKPIKPPRKTPPRVVLRQPGQYSLSFEDTDNDPATPPKFQAVRQ
jgi:hypothetical protein